MSEITHGSGFVEVGDRCWMARFEHLDVNVGLVGGERGLLVVDTNASEALARETIEQVRALGAGEVVAVVNTHVHFDHVYGNATFADEYDAPPLYAHEETAAALPEYAGETFSSARVVDLGDRLVELIHPGRGHTAGDAVVRVGDADVLFAGDLVEESALRHGVPGYGDDCYPMEWPPTLDLVVSMLTDASVVVPGHGAPVDLDFVQDQRSAIGVVAETIRDLASRGVPVSEALDAAEWPYPKEELGHAVLRGYAHLPRSARSLPLL